MKFSALSSSLVLISSLGFDGINANDSVRMIGGSILSMVEFCVRHAYMCFRFSTYPQSPSLRGNSRRALRVQHPCTLVRVETQYDYQLEENFESNRQKLYEGAGRAGNRKLQADDDLVKCELSEVDRQSVGKYFVNVNGIESSQLENIVSGDTTILAEGATIMDGEMYLPADASIEFGSNEENRRKLQSWQEYSRRNGIKKVLVVRANGQGSSTTANSQTLSDKIFGTHGDTATLRSQYQQCSHGKLDLQPFEGTTRGGTYINGGVLDVNIDMYVPGANRYAVEDALENAADQLVGGLRDQFDHVMLCLPPGTSQGQW